MIGPGCESCQVRGRQGGSRIVDIQDVLPLSRRVGVDDG